MKRAKPQSSFVSDISKIVYPLSEKVNIHTLKGTLAEFIQEKHPGVSSDSCLSLTELNQLRHQFIANVLEKETKDISALEKLVLEKINDNETITDKLDQEERSQSTTMGQKVADHVATFGGSWKFIILFGVFIVIWISVNIFWLFGKAFDPYPFILLNLILSCIAALQAPVIMMSQNRQEEKDRERARKDYMINLKSELEIRLLHEKMDHLIIHQQSKLLEIQEVQVEMLNDVINKLAEKKG
jgi:uncharacterized membrane protein